MAFPSLHYNILCFFAFLLLFGAAYANFSPAYASFSSDFYSSKCPKALSTIKTAVNNAVAKEYRMGASLLRLHFHDCFVNACFLSSLSLVPMIFQTHYSMMFYIKTNVQIKACMHVEIS